MIGILLAGATAILAAATAISEKKGVKWYVRYFDFPREQILGASALLAPAVAAKTRGAARKALVATLGAVMGWQALKMWRFTRLGPYQSLPARRSDPGLRCRILIANVWMPNRNAPGLLRAVASADADVVLLLETDHWWAEQVASLDRIYPYSLKQPLENTYGLMLYSRLPWSEASIRTLLLEDVPSAVARIHLKSGGSFLLYAVHPLPPGVSQDTTHRDAELVLVGKEARKKDEAAVVAGDLNDVAWSYTTRLFQKASGMLDPRMGRGFYNTFNARWPLIRWPLDHVFHTRHFRLVSLERLGKFGSDHFPVLIELSYEPDGGRAQTPPKLEPEDRQAVEEKLEEARESGMLD